jgi:hypothetical protein
LSGAVYWSNKKTKADAEKPPADASPKVLVLPEDEIRQLVIKRRGGAENPRSLNGMMPANGKSPRRNRFPETNTRSTRLRMPFPT